MKTEEKILFAEKRIEELELLIHAWKCNNKKISEELTLNSIKDNTYDYDLPLVA